MTVFFANPQAVVSSLLMATSVAVVWLVLALRRVQAQRRLVERELARLELEKSAAQAGRVAAEAADRARTRFFLAACHDLRQPLHAMGLFAQALHRQLSGKSSPAPAREGDAAAADFVMTAARIVESIEVLEILFDEVLDLTRIDGGDVVVAARPFAMSDLYARLRPHFEPLAFDRGLTLDFLGGHRVVFADPLLVERILRNLLANALRHTSEGGVLVGARARGGEVLLQVWDSGEGIAEAELPRIFDEFHQVARRQPPQGSRRKGLGLGLAIVKRLAGLMGAPIHVRSCPGRGTVFSLWLPVAGNGSSSPGAPVA